MRNDPFVPRALRDANRRLDVTRKQIERLTLRHEHPRKKKGFFARLFGRIWGQ
jgi:hypothetical protein